MNSYMGKRGDGLTSRDCLSWKNIFNERFFFLPLYYLILNEQHTVHIKLISIYCLYLSTTPRDPQCLPLGGQSIWSSLGPLVRIQDPMIFGPSCILNDLFNF